MEMPGYGEDLAYIHDAGFRDYALKAAPGLLGILGRSGIRSGLVVDLGCGSGRLAAELNRAGYEALGVDQSPAMIQLARRIAPAAQFKIGSLLTVRIPPCDALTSIGECVNYLFDRRNSRKALSRLFRRVHRALKPGGVFVFDFADPGRLAKRLPQKSWVEGDDWAVLVSTEGDPSRQLLRREITCFRKAGKLFRRSQETHVLRLYRARDLEQDLERCGFQVRIAGSYGGFHLPTGIRVIVAHKSG